MKNSTFDTCGLLVAESLTVNVPPWLPNPPPVNDTRIVQALMAARLEPQVVEATASSPVVEIAILFRVVAILLCRVNVLGQPSDACETRSEPDAGENIPNILDFLTFTESIQ